MKQQTSRYLVYWTKSAQLDLREILDFIANDNPSAARKLFTGIKKEVSRLSHNPERCRTLFEFEELGLADFRELLIKPYRIVFKITGNSVFVMAVIDGRRDLETVLFRRLVRM